MKSKPYAAIILTFLAHSCALTGREVGINSYFPKEPSDFSLLHSRKVAGISFVLRSSGVVHMLGSSSFYEYFIFFDNGRVFSLVCTPDTLAGRLGSISGGVPGYYSKDDQGVSVVRYAYSTGSLDYEKTLTRFISETNRDGEWTAAHTLGGVYVREDVPTPLLGHSFDLKW